MLRFWGSTYKIHFTRQMTATSISYKQSLEHTPTPKYEDKGGTEDSWVI